MEIEGLTVDSSAPDHAWDQLRGKIVQQIAQNVYVAGEEQEKPEGHLRVVCISDTHALEGKMKKDNIPPGDILIHGVVTLSSSNGPQS